MLYILAISLLVESITQILIKSLILQDIRVFLLKKINNEKFTYLLSCGYCSSFWIATLLNLIGNYLSVSIILVDSKIINITILILITHRLSNIIHGAIDKYFDKSYDIRYNKN